MHSSRLTCGVRKFTPEDVNSPDFLRALEIYAQTTGPTCKTDTRQITYWMERFDQSDSLLFAYGLYKNDEVIGFCLSFYFPDSKLLVIDHMAIDVIQRSYGSFFQFSDLIQKLLHDSHIEISYVIVEVVTSETGHPMTLDPYVLIRLLKMIQFKVAKIEYFIPETETYEIGIPTKGVLMVYSLGDAKQITSELFLSLITTLHEKLYIKWYTPFFSENIGAYKKSLNEQRRKLSASVSKKKTITLNGYADTVMQPENRFHEIKKKNQNVELSQHFLLVSLSFVMIGGCAIALGLTINTSKVSLNSLIGLFLLSGLIFTLVASIWMPKTRKVLEHFSSVFLKFFGKK